MWMSVVSFTLRPIDRRYTLVSMMCVCVPVQVCMFWRSNSLDSSGIRSSNVQSCSSVPLPTMWNGNQLNGTNLTALLLSLFSIIPTLNWLITADLQPSKTEIYDDNNNNNWQATYFHHLGVTFRLMFDTYQQVYRSCAYLSVTYFLTPWCRVVLEKLGNCSQSGNSPHFMEPGRSLPHSQLPATCPILSQLNSLRNPHPTSRISNLIRSGIQNISEWCRHLYSSCGSTNNLSQQAKPWIPCPTATFSATAWKRVKTSPRTLARTHLAASPWQRPVSHFRPHPAVSGEIQNGCHPQSNVLPWFSTLWRLPIYKHKIQAERTPVFYHWVDPRRIAESA
jgi:hypothetical protein